MVSENDGKAISQIETVEPEETQSRRPLGLYEACLRSGRSSSSRFPSTNFASGIAKETTRTMTRSSRLKQFDRASYLS